VKKTRPKSQDARIREAYQLFQLGIGLLSKRKYQYSLFEEKIKRIITGFSECQNSGRKMKLVVQW